MNFRNIQIVVLENGSENCSYISNVLVGQKIPGIQLENCNSMEKLSLLDESYEFNILLVDTSFQISVSDFEKLVAYFSQKVPVVLLVENDDDSIALKGIAKGAIDFLEKDSFDNSQFMETISKAMKKHQVSSDLKNAIIEYRKNEQRMINIILDNADGILIIDENKIIKFINPSACSLLSKSNDELLGTTFEYEASVDQRTEIVLFSRNGSKRTLEIVGVETIWENRNALLISMRDISEHKKKEEGLKNALANLEYALASEKVLLEELNRRNLDLVELSIKDGLTGLYNHRFIQEKIDHEFKRAKRYGTRLSCMLIDIDHFKRINDTYGHQFGDLVLRELSAILRMNIREVDLCGRYGGEEFMILTAQESERALLHANKVSKAIENHNFENDDNSIHVTVSIGISEYSPELDTKQELIERADIALYKAKEDGRNLIRVWKKDVRKNHENLDESGITTLKDQVNDLSEKARIAYVESMYALLKAVDAKDHYTLNHSENVAKYAVMIGKELNIEDSQLTVIKNAALLHDIGKVGIDEEVLVKTSPLSDHEFNLLKMHSTIGVTILKDVHFLEREIPLILHHHERYDGSGYPQSLKGKEIPLGALILGIADAFDAMTTSRVYQEKMSLESAVNELKKGMGKQFSPEIVNALVKLIEEKGENIFSEKVEL